MNGVAMAVAAYLRVSTEEQRERQFIETQREEIQRNCLAHGLTILREYAHDGVSGTVPMEDRPAGRDLLRDARLKKFDQLLVYKLDRIGRETLLILQAFAQFSASGVRTKSITEVCDAESSDGKVMLAVYSVPLRTFKTTEMRPARGEWRNAVALRRRCRTSWQQSKLGQRRRP
jgi:DNA invertase Pin-like site-specific DNA recombinase